jgi:hypothetical protein
MNTTLHDHFGQVNMIATVKNPSSYGVGCGRRPPDPLGRTEGSQVLAGSSPGHLNRQETIMTAT